MSALVLPRKDSWLSHEKEQNRVKWMIAWLCKSKDSIIILMQNILCLTFRSFQISRLSIFLIYIFKTLYVVFVHFQQCYIFNWYVHSLQTKFMITWDSTLMSFNHFARRWHSVSFWSVPVSVPGMQSFWGRQAHHSKLYSFYFFFF